MAKLPVKLRVFEYMTQNEQPLTADDIFSGIKDEYAGESQMKPERIDEYLSALMGVNMIKENEVSFDEDGELLIKYEVTDFGKSRIKYIPKNKDN